MLLPEDLCKRSPSFGALVIREEAPSPLPIGDLSDGLPKLTIQHRVMVAQGYRLLLLSSSGSSALPGSHFCLGIPHQDRLETPHPYFHPPGDTRLYRSGPADTQHIRKDDVGEEKGYLGVLTPVNYPLPLYDQDGREAAPHCSCGRGVPANRLCG